MCKQIHVSHFTYWQENTRILKPNFGISFDVSVTIHDVKWLLYYPTEYPLMMYSNRQIGGIFLHLLAGSRTHRPNEHGTKFRDARTCYSNDKFRYFTNAGRGKLFDWQCGEWKERKKKKTNRDLSHTVIRWKYFVRSQEHYYRSVYKNFVFILFFSLVIYINNFRLMSKTKRNRMW